MSWPLPLSASSATPQVIVHVAAAGGSVAIGVLVGGATVLVGVLATELLVRLRERRASLNRALLDVQTAASGYLGGISKDKSVGDIIRDYGDFTAAVGRVRFAARWPLRNARAIRNETDAILGRWFVALAQMRVTTVPPKLGPVIGDHLRKLVGGENDAPEQAINAALGAAGFPDLAKWDDPDAWRARAPASTPPVED